MSINKVSKASLPRTGGIINSKSRKLKLKLILFKIHFFLLTLEINNIKWDFITYIKPYTKTY